jgi:hypothetical protein
MNNERHTAIPCEHPTSVIRDRMTAVLQDILDCDSDTLIVDINIAVSRVTAECVAIMHEHAEEIAGEYRSIIGRINQ